MPLAFTKAPELRLAGGIAPTAYTASLNITPNRDTFTGHIIIDLTVHAPSNEIWLNAINLTFTKAQLTAGGKTLAARVLPSPDQFAGFGFDREIGPGAAQLTIDYSGRISRISSAGIFELPDNGNWYVYTQFEPTDARRAFPCFDEPSFKVPWQLTLTVPSGAKAFSNTPAQGTTFMGSIAMTQFTRTRPLPSYLVAFAVGPFDIVDAGHAGSKHTPLRIIVPKGHAPEAAYAAATVPQLLDRLETYFGIPFPYDKLDSVAMPISNFAMENAGLITYGSGSLLSKPSEDTIRRQRGMTEVAAHEMAHQWFGDLVTTDWWNDIWLNEAFASWMEGKIVSEWKPDWHVEVAALEDKFEAMGLDSLMSTRRITQPIRSAGDIANAFDAITYQKGSAVIRMFEHWIGTDTFRRGVQGYLHTYADRNASTAEFLTAISKAAGRDIAPAFDTFLDQPGIPVVTARLDCNAKPPALHLAQHRYLPIGSPGRTNTKARSEQWQIPVCMAYGDASSHDHRQCTLLSQTAADLQLKEGNGCPAWLNLNEGAYGYYRAREDDKMIAGALAEGGRRLSLAGRVSMLNDLIALTESGDVPPSTALAVVPEFAAARDHNVVKQDTAIAGLTEADFMPASERPKSEAYIRRTFAPRARTLGWGRRAADSNDTLLMRATLVPFAARNGADPELLNDAGALARRWLQDRSAITDRGMIADVLQAAAQNGNRDLFEKYLAAAKAAPDSRTRRELLRGLGSFRDPAIVESALGLLLTGEFDAREAFVPLLLGPLRYPETRDLPFQFVRAHVDQLLARLPREVGGDFAAMLPETGRDFCDAQHRSEVQSFFAGRVQNYIGGERTLHQVIEAIGTCMAQKRALEPEIAAYLNH